VTPDPSLTIVYTGPGKGKTTAAFGLALRMLGHGWKVLVLQFIKGPIETGERIAARRLAPDLIVRTLGQGYLCLHGAPPTEKDRRLAADSWKIARDALASGTYDAVILDEINVLTSLGLIPVDALLHLIESRPPQLTLVLTGRSADPRVCSAADIVTEMSSPKHVFTTGRSDIEGIDR